MRHAYAKRRAQRLFPSRCEILRAPNPDALPDPVLGKGGTPVVVETIACAVIDDRSTAEERGIADQLRGRTPVTIAVPHDTALGGADKIRRVGGPLLEILGDPMPGDNTATLILKCAKV